MRSFFHPLQDRHVPKSYLNRGQMRQPQELPERTGCIVEALEKLGQKVEEPQDRGMKMIGRVHHPDYLRFLESAHRRWPADWSEEVISNIHVRSPNPLRGIVAEAARYQADGSCPIGAGTWEAAYWSAQTALAAAEAIRGGERLAYGLCRPPGHHARPDAAGGFCYLNNAAIAAESLLPDFPRIAIVDPDMHHGQGIQETFYERNDVLYVSVHGDPTNFYPVVTGFEDERGAGAGEGYNLNLPMPHGTSEEGFLERIDEAVTAVRLFEPDLLIVTLGFDIYKNDPQAKVSVSSPGFARMAERFAALKLPLLVIQEGGYDLESLGENTRQFFSALLDA